MNPKIQQAFKSQSEGCLALGSPFTGRLCAAIAENMDGNTRLGQIIDNWPGDASSAGDALPLRLCGALHALVLDGADEILAAAFPDKLHKWSDEALWSAIQQALIVHEDFVIERLGSAPQTNEVRRCGALVPGILAIADHFNWPLVLSEIGSSAGLNLNWDRYQYSFGDKSWGSKKSPVHLTPEWHGTVPRLGPVEILSREGCDLNPLDMTAPEDRSRLTSYLWPDQIDRIERTRRAIIIAKTAPPTVVKAGAAEWLKQRLGTVHQGAIHIVFHSIMWQYLSDEEQADCRMSFAQAGANATKNSALAWLRMEVDEDTDGAGIYVTLWPDGETKLIGRADFHGRWVKWFGL